MHLGHRALHGSSADLRRFVLRLVELSEDWPVEEEHVRAIEALSRWNW
jgi:hypothetical protein